MKLKTPLILYVLAFLMQGSLLNIIAIHGTTPNLLLCLTVCFAFLYDKTYYAVIFGTLFGILADTCFMQYVGVSSLGYLFVALGIMSMSRIISKEHVVSIVIVSAASTVFFGLFRYVIYVLMDYTVSFTAFLQELPWLIVYNIVICILLYAVMIRRVDRFRRDRKYWHS